MVANKYGRCGIVSVTILEFYAMIVTVSDGYIFADNTVVADVNLVENADVDIMIDVSASKMQ